MESAFVSTSRWVKLNQLEAYPRIGAAWTRKDKVVGATCHRELWNRHGANIRFINFFVQQSQLIARSIILGSRLPPVASVAVKLFLNDKRGQASLYLATLVLVNSRNTRGPYPRK